MGMVSTKVGVMVTDVVRVRLLKRGISVNITEH